MNNNVMKNWYKIAKLSVDGPGLPILLNEKIPSKLYHATYKPYLESIMKNGLNPNFVKKPSWEFSKGGVICLANDPYVAESYCETTGDVPEEYLDQIVVLEVDTKNLNKKMLFWDENINFGGEDAVRDSYEYHGIISPQSIKVLAL
jgi:hypothetical protein